MSGPYETEADVVVEVGDIYAGYCKPGVMQARTLRLLMRACVENGVELGEYDRLVLRRLAAQRPETAQVIASLIARAATAARPAAAKPGGRAGRAAGPCARPSGEAPAR